MAVPDNSIIRVAAHFLQENASDIVNVYHFVVDSVGDISDANALADVLALIQALMANVEGFYSTGLALDFITMWLWNSSLSRWDLVGETDGTWAGTQGSVDWSPVAVSPIVNAGTVDAHAKGRKFLPPPLETATGGGLWVAGFLTALAAYLADYIAAYIGTFAQYAPGVWQDATDTFKAFDGTGTVSNQPGYQRRRKVGVGE